MQLIVKHFSELTTDELFDIYKLRSAVFVVEQNCIYQDIDDADKVAYHMYLKDENGIQAYLRVLPKGVRYEEVSIGRVISVKRRCGFATRLLNEAILVAKEKFGANTLVISSQKYAIPVYEKVGFVPCSGEYMEDGIPHIRMMLEIHENYEKEAQEKWGDTAAYREYSEKTKNSSQTKQKSVNEGMNNILAEFALCMKSGAAPDSQEAQNLVKKLQDYISENYYTCTKEILAGLGQMYVLDERFKRNIDKNANGTAQFICNAIENFYKNN